MIKDKMQLQGFGGVKLPKIKGEVEIRLHNPTTGKTEIQRGENMITNAVSDIFAANFCGALDYRKCLPLYEKMFGGVLCFKRAFTQAEMVATDYFIPNNDETVDSQTNVSKGNPVTAHAGQSTVTDQTDDPTRGSKSAGNMSVTDGTVKFAFEWGLTEGNGDISALSLTHTDIGTGGTGSTSTAFRGISPSLNANYGTAWTTNIHFIDGDGYAYVFYPDTSVQTATNKIIIKKFPFAYAQTGLVGQIFAKTNDISGNPIELTSEIEVDTSYPHYTSGTHHNPFYAFDASTNKLWLFYNADYSNSVSVDVIDLSDFGSLSTTHYNWTLGSTDATKVGVLSSPHWAIPVTIYDGYVYLPNNGYWQGVGRFVKVKMVSSPADITAINAPSGTYGQPSTMFKPNTANKILAGKSFVINTNSSGSPILYPATVPSPDTWGWYDMSRRISTMTYMEQGSGLARLAWTGTNNSPQYYMSISKFYLATKFNLTSPVTKSPSQSMIVTYTLTEVPPNANE